MGERLRCRPGDLAIVTRCRVPERIGMIVRVIERCTDRGYDWLTEVQGPGMYGRDITTGKLGNCRFGLWHDWNLTPIRGEPLADSESASRTRAAPVV
ncbi:hypothetical protein MJ547_16180, partial [Burkholderia gladioli]